MYNEREREKKKLKICSPCISTAGEVKLASGQSFDYESGMRTFVLTCAADDSFFQSTASVTLSIVDANDAPTLSPASVAVTAEEGPVGFCA